MTEKEPTVYVVSSHAKGNCPPGYLIIHVDLHTGHVLETELNPYTNLKFKYLGVRTKEAHMHPPNEFVTGWPLSLHQALHRIEEWFPVWAVEYGELRPEVNPATTSTLCLKTHYVEGPNAS